MTNKRVVLASRPVGAVSEANFRVEEAPVPKPADGDVLVRNLWLSLDPYMRGRMSDAKSYVKGVDIGEVMVGQTVGEVLESRHPKLKVGDTVLTQLGWQLYGATKEATRIDTSRAPASYYLGLLGMPGLTAYFGLKELGQPKPGETVVVSAASGAVGSVVGQLAKLWGARAVGIAGGGEKCRYVKEELGFDACIDYKAGRLRDELKEACPKGVDVYFDNVGGEILDLALARMNLFGRIVVCGTISDYNSTDPYRVRNWRAILVNRLRVQGMIVFDWKERYGERALRRGAEGARRLFRRGQAQVSRVHRPGAGECAARADGSPRRQKFRQTTGETMIDLYTWPTPNGHKIHIMLEETGLEYKVHAIDIGAGEQFKPDFLAISPNNKIPAMVDQQGPDGKRFALAESGAMLFYLASKTGKFLPNDLKKKWQVMQWVMTQMGHVGPMLGQAHHFLQYAPEKIEYAMNRYRNEASRLYGVIDAQLKKSEWLACDEYTIADIATFPWLRAPERQGVNIDDFPHLKKWRERIAGRPAVKKAVEVLADRRRPTPSFNKEQAEVLFGATQYQKR